MAGTTREEGSNDRTLFLIAHLAETFSCSPARRLNKNYRFSGLAMHAVLYLVCVSAVSFLRCPQPGFAVVLVLSFLHFLIEIVGFLVRRNHPERDVCIVCGRSAAHILVMIVSSGWR
jgi:hypothetical protein